MSIGDVRAHPIALRDSIGHQEGSFDGHPINYSAPFILVYQNHITPGSTCSSNSIVHQLKIDGGIIRLGFVIRETHTF